MGFDRVYPVHYEINFQVQNGSHNKLDRPYQPHPSETWGKSTVYTPTPPSFVDQYPSYPSPGRSKVVGDFVHRGGMLAWEKNSWQPEG